jgi:hypothetical protein
MAVQIFDTVCATPRLTRVNITARPVQPELHQIRGRIRATQKAANRNATIGNTA